MKTKSKLKHPAMFIALLMTSFLAFGQGNNVRLNGNNNFDATSKVGPTNNADFKFITRDSTRMTITKAGDVIINKSLTVDSLNVKRILIVGNPFSITDASPAAPFPATRSWTGVLFNVINGTSRKLVLEGSLISDSPTLRDDISFGIGVFNTLAGPVARLHLNDNRTIFGTATNVFEKFTNAFTGAGVGDGFNIGVTGGVAVNAQHALLNQLEQSRHILLQLTPATSAAAGGNVGIDGPFSFALGNYPKRKLDVIDDGAFTTGGRPQLRLTQRPDPITANGTFTDFQTTALGDLAINPRIAGVERRVGININAPANTLEINSPSLVLSSTASGLKFTDVNNGVVPPANTTTGVLSLDNIGNVIWVQGGGAGTGNVSACTSPAPITNYLTKWSPAPTDICNSQFIDDGANTGITAVIPTLKFFVPASAPAFINAGTFTIGGTSTSSTVSAIQATANVTSGVSQIYGVRADVAGSGGSQNYGVLGLCSGSGFNFGGVFSATGAGGYGIYASVLPNTSGLAGYFDGDVYTNGGLNSGTGYLVATSDAMFKTNITPITNSLSIINQLLPKTYFMDTTNSHNLRFTSKRQYGLVAQDVENVLPELVSFVTKPTEFDSQGNITYQPITYKGLNYNAFIGIIIKGMQEQQAQIDSLMNNSVRIQSSNQTFPAQTAILASKNCMLFQNAPNPFGESTSITYFLPDAIANAEMVFYDMYGSEIHRIQLQNKGTAKVEVNTKDLASGIYSYSLIADGKVIDTMKMIRVK